METIELHLELDTDDLIAINKAMIVNIRAANPNGTYVSMLDGHSVWVAESYTDVFQML